MNTESTYDWNSKQWSVPINASIAKLVWFGKLPVSLGLNARYWADTPDSDPASISRTADSGSAQMFLECRG